LILGGDYQISQSLANLPSDSGILLVRESDPWFINYYMLPRRLYIYSGATNEAELMKIPDKWIKEKGIDHVLLYTKTSVGLLKVGKDIKFK